MLRDLARKADIYKRPKNFLTKFSPLISLKFFSFFVELDDFFTNKVPSLYLNLNRKSETPQLQTYCQFLVFA